MIVPLLSSANYIFHEADNATFWCTGYLLLVKIEWKLYSVALRSIFLFSSLSLSLSLSLQRDSVIVRECVSGEVIGHMFYVWGLPKCSVEASWDTQIDDSKRKDGQTTIDVKPVIIPKLNIQQKLYIQASIYTDHATHKLQLSSFSASMQTEASSLSSLPVSWCSMEHVWQILCASVLILTSAYMHNIYTLLKHPIRKQKREKTSSD